MRFPLLLLSELKSKANFGLTSDLFLGSGNKKQDLILQGIEAVSAKEKPENKLHPMIRREK